MKRTLQGWVATGSRVAPLRRLFYWGYRSQLFTMVQLLARSPAVRAILIRRPGVIEDLYPGESDFDLTIVLGADADAAETVEFARLLRRVKRVCPPLGETAIVSEADLSEHLAHRFSTYFSARPTVLYQRGPLAIPAPAPRAHDLVLSTGERLRNVLWPALVRFADAERPVLSRDLLKIERKITWTEEVLAAGAGSDMVYRAPEFPAAPYLTAAERCDKVRELLDRLESSGFEVPNTDPIEISLEGSVEPPSERDRALLENAVAHLRRYGRPEIRQFRLYPLTRCITLESDTPFVYDLEFARALAAAARNLDKTGLFLAFNYVAPLDPQGIELWRALDPLAAAFSSATSAKKLRIDRSVLEYELATSVMMFRSCLRREDPIYLTSLFYDSILPLTRALTEFRLRLAPRHPSERQTLDGLSAFEIYRRLVPLMPSRTASQFCAM